MTSTKRPFQWVGETRTLLLCLILIGSCTTPNPGSNDEPVQTTVTDTDTDTDTETAAYPDTDTDTDTTSTNGYYSSLYPDIWTPEFTDAEGRFLHDFSYAGYRSGESGLPNIAGPVFDVTAYGALFDDLTDATAAIQSAIDAAEVAGGVVLFPTGTYRIDGTLRVEASDVVLRGEGPDSKLHFTKTIGMSDTAHLTFSGVRATGAEALAVTDLVSRGFDVEVADASVFSAGDEVEIGWEITPEFVAEHGMTGVWGPFNDAWVTFWRRTVVDVDLLSTPQRITLDAPHRYAGLVRDGVSIIAVSGQLTEVGIEDLSVTNAQDTAGANANDRNHVIDLIQIRDGWVTRVESFHHLGEGGGHLQSGGLRVLQSRGVTVSDSSFENAQNRGGGGNGYLVEVSQVTDVLIERVRAENGRHNLIQNWGFGATGVVWKDCFSSGSTAYNEPLVWLGVPAYSEFHHSLATANLIEGGVWNDGFKAEDRGLYSSGAGASATESVFWNVGGSGLISTDQFGWGYVIGASSALTVRTNPIIGPIDGPPEDWVETVPAGQVLTPASLYEDQLARRLAP